METNMEKLATFLHNKFCSYNHTDGCGWDYEGDDWSQHTHKRWLEAAREVTGFINELTR